MKKRTVREKNNRKKMQEAMTSKSSTPYVSNYGMTPAQIRKALGKKDKVPSKDVLRRSQPKKSNKPQHATRTRGKNSHLMLGIPEVTTELAIEYPTPSWFRYNSKADVSVIIPMYKSHSVVKDLIKSWKIGNDKLKVEMIFVDDNCPGNSKSSVINTWEGRKKELKMHAPPGLDVHPVGRIYSNPVNMGFGTACNIGAYHSTGRFLIFLNADTQVIAGWIKPMIELLLNKDVGIVGNMQLKQGDPWHGTIDGAGSEWSWNNKCFDHIGRHSYKLKRITKPFHPKNCPEDVMQEGERDMVTGCCIGITKELFQEVGGFNPHYRIGYWEDSEMCMSVKEKGYKVMFTPKSVIWHKLGHTSSGDHKYGEHNRNYFINKWVNSGRIDPLVNDKRDKAPVVDTILLRRHTAHGDVLMAAATAAALKQKHPECRILFNTKHPELVKDNPYIDEVITDKKIGDKTFKVFYNLDMCYESKPYVNMLDAYANEVGVKRQDCRMFLKTQPVKNLPNKYIVMHSTKYSGWVGRDWSSYKFEAISSRLKKFGYDVVCVGTKGDLDIPSALDLRGKTNIWELAYVIRNSRFFIGVDSLPMHVAQVFETPGVAFFGSIDPKYRIIRNNMEGVVAEGLKCLGCHHRRPTPCTSTSQCETGTLDCVQMVSVENMWRKIEKRLEV